MTALESDSAAGSVQVWEEESAAACSECKVRWECKASKGESSVESLEEYLVVHLSHSLRGSRWHREISVSPPAASPKRKIPAAFPAPMSAHGSPKPCTSIRRSSPTATEKPASQSPSPTTSPPGAWR